MSDAISATPEQVSWCEQCNGRVGIDVDCDEGDHVHRLVPYRRRRAPKSGLLAVGRLWSRRIDIDAPAGASVDDGFGNAWERCVRTDCDLQVVRPGKAQCRGDHDELGCPRDVYELVERLYGELARLADAGDALAAGVRIGRWDDALDAWDEARRGWDPPSDDAAEHEAQR